jgi:hypothetical protein
MRKFTPQEDLFLRENYLTLPTKTMSKMLGRADVSARQRLKLLGLKVPAELAQKFKGSSQYAKGHTPVTKGKAMADLCSADALKRMAKTQFKKGSRPHNHKPVGSERLTKDGYLEMKIAEPNKWKALHRIMWEETFGPIPQGMNVQFVTKDKMNLSPWNLELRSKADNMKKNSYHNYGPEIAKAIQLIGVLNRQINKRCKTLKN